MYLVRFKANFQNDNIMFSGVLGFVWLALWSFLVESDPNDHRWVSEQEYKIIMNGIPKASTDDNKSSRRPKTPWLKICTSPSVWGLVSGKIAQCWSYFFIFSKLPSYLNTVLHLPTTKVSMNCNSESIKYNSVLEWFNCFDGVCSCMPFIITFWLHLRSDN